MSIIKDVTELVRIKKEIAKVSQELSALDKVRSDLVRTLQSECEHTQLITTREYMSGGYDHVSKVLTTKTCAMCDKEISREYDPNHRGSFQ